MVLYWSLYARREVELLTVCDTFSARVFDTVPPSLGGGGGGESVKAAIIRDIYRMVSTACKNTLLCI